MWMVQLKLCFNKRKGKKMYILRYLHWALKCKAKVKHEWLRFLWDFSHSPSFPYTVTQCFLKSCDSAKQNGQDIIFSPELYSPCPLVCVKNRETENKSVRITFPDEVWREAVWLAGGVAVGPGDVVQQSAVSLSRGHQLGCDGSAQPLLLAGNPQGDEEDRNMTVLLPGGWSNSRPAPPTVHFELNV